MSYEDKFMCSCHNDGRAECEAILAEAKQRLSHGEHECTDANFLTYVTYSLDGMGVNITTIAADQWCGVAAEQHTYNEKTGKFEEGEAMSFMCDQVEHGVAAIWKYYADKAEDQKEPV